MFESRQLTSDHTLSRYMVCEYCNTVLHVSICLFLQAVGVPRTSDEGIKLPVSYKNGVSTNNTLERGVEIITQPLRLIKPYA